MRLARVHLSALDLEDMLLFLQSLSGRTLVLSQQVTAYVASDHVVDEDIEDAPTGVGADDDASSSGSDADAGPAVGEGEDDDTSSIGTGDDASSCGPGADSGAEGQKGEDDDTSSSGSSLASDGTSSGTSSGDNDSVADSLSDDASADTNPGDNKSDGDAASEHDDGDETSSEGTTSTGTSLEFDIEENILSRQAAPKQKSPVTPRAKRPPASAVAPAQECNARVSEPQACVGQPKTGANGTKKRNARRRAAAKARNAAQEGNQGTELPEHGAVPEPNTLEKKKQDLLDIVSTALDRTSPAQEASPAARLGGTATIHALPSAGGQGQPAENGLLKKMRLDLGAGRRMLFGALGLRNPKTKEDEDKIRADMMKGVRPLVNSRTTEGSTAQSEDTISTPNGQSVVEVNPRGLARQDRVHGCRMLP